MKKLIATGLTFFMLISSMSVSVFADVTQGNEEGLIDLTTSNSVNLEYKRPNKKYRCDLKAPKFKSDPDCDKDERVYYSSQGKLSLNLDECPDFSDKACVSVTIAEPKMKRCWKTINPSKFGRKIVKADPAENSFMLRGPLRQAEWWNIKDRVKYWWNPQTINVNYAIVLTSPEEERILEAKEVQEGQKKKTVIDAEKVIERIKNLNPENDLVSRIKKSRLERLQREAENLGRDYGMRFMRAEHLEDLQDNRKIDKSLYYTKKEADEFNKDLREKKAKVLLSFANKEGKDLITSGEITKLSKTHPEQTFRLIINNNMGDCEAAKLSMMLSNSDSYKFITKDTEELKLKFKSTYVRMLPEYLQQECDEKNLARIILDMKSAENKLTFGQFLSKFVPGIFKDLYALCTSDSNLGSRVSQWVKEVKEKIPQKRNAVDEEIGDDSFGAGEEDASNDLGEEGPVVGSRDGAGTGETQAIGQPGNAEQSLGAGNLYGAVEGQPNAEGLSHRLGQIYSSMGGHGENSTSDSSSTISDVN